MVCQFVIRAKGRATIFGNVAVDGCPNVLRSCTLGRHVTLVNPKGMQIALCIKQHRFEAMGNFLTVLVHRERGRKCLSAICTSKHSNKAGIGLGQRLRVSHNSPAIGAKSHFGTRLPICCNLILLGVEYHRRCPLPQGLRG